MLQKVVNQASAWQSTRKCLQLIVLWRSSDPCTVSMMPDCISAMQCRCAVYTAYLAYEALSTPWRKHSHRRHSALLRPV